MRTGIICINMAKLSKEDVLKLARLSKLELTQAQLERFPRELEEIVEYVEQLQSVDVVGLEPTNQVTGLTNVMREDELADYASPDDLLKNSPAREGNLIKVRRVL
jgi:aspartyl-tRNA(Asn)/glutamyl-tRNA(Gln) amidotransferase subunit C